MKGYVYAVRCGAFVKIGWSVKPESRAVKINSDNPMPCQLLGYYEATTAEERAVQHRFKAYHEHSEWFRYEGAVEEFCGSLPNKPAPVRRSSRGRKLPSKYERSFMRGFAKKHGDLTRWARELGLKPESLSHWEQVPVHRVLDVERVTGIPREKLRPDLFAEAA